MLVDGHGPQAGRGKRVRIAGRCPTSASLRIWGAWHGSTVLNLHALYLRQGRTSLIVFDPKGNLVQVT
jgi:hypothetical protein